MTSEGIDFCILGLQGSDASFYVLGDTFLRSFISVYDFDNKRVGLAPAIQIDPKKGLKPRVIDEIQKDEVIILN
jgi:hypothetical protein